MLGFPELIASYPLNGAVDVLLGTQITLDWSVDIDLAQLSDANELSKRIVVVDQDSNQFLTVQFVSYTAKSKRVTLNVPNLRAGTQYKLTVRSGFKDANGRKTFQEYHVGFTTNDAQFSTVNLLSPPDGGTFVQSPYTFTWTASVASTGVVSLGYDVNFYEGGNILGTFTTITNSLVLSPGSYEGVLGDVLGRSLGWDVTVRDNVGGSGSVIYGPASARQTVLFSRPTQPVNPASSSTYTYEQFEIEAPFVVLSYTPEDNETNLSAISALKLTFSQDVDPTTVSANLSLTRKDQLPRNDIASSYLELPVTGSWTVTGQVVEFHFLEQLYANARYTIKALPDLKDVNGNFLGTAFSSRFSTLYSPYYVDLRVVKSKLRSEAATMPDDMINYYIYLQSLQANALFQANALGLPGLASAFDSFPEGLVRDNIKLRGYGVLNWVLSSTLYEIYASILVDEIRNVGRKRKLNDYEESLSSDFLEAIKAAQAKVKGEMDYWQQYLSYSPMDSISVASRGSLYDYDAHMAVDLMFDCSERGRGDYV